MRYHKAIEISKAEADLSIATAEETITGTVVISQAEKWYDVRAMTDDELKAFIADLERLAVNTHDEEMRKLLPN